MIRRITMFFVLFLALGGARAAMAQHGSIELDEADKAFPASYHGATWTGKVVSVENGVLTISAERKVKTETFVAKLPAGVGAVDNGGFPITGSVDLKPGARVLLYYSSKGQEHTVVRLKMMDVAPTQKR